MKSNLFFAVAILVAMAVSCNSAGTKETKTEAVAAAKDPMIRSWVLDSVDASGEVANQPKDQQTGMKEAMASFDALQKGRMVLDIQENNKVTMTDLGLSGNTEVSEGTWSLSQDKKNLTLDFSDGKKEFLIVGLSAEKLSLELKNEKGISMLFVPKS